MFSQIYTRAIIHETTSILTCRGGGGQGTKKQNKRKPTEGKKLVFY
jgi:hypothetical protein